MGYEGTIPPYHYRTESVLHVYERRAGGAREEKPETWAEGMDSGASSGVKMKSEVRGISSGPHVCT